MSSYPSRERVPRVIFFGMQSNFSIPSLQALLESGVDVCAVVLPALVLPGSERRPIQRRNPSHLVRAPLSLLNGATPSLLHIAWARGIPVWEVGQLGHADTLAALTAYRPDCLCVACFPARLPHDLLALPRLASLNVHPSLLPANRGPVPLFWTFRLGESQTGVTIHQMDERMDSGEILAQEKLEIPDGISYAQLEQACAKRGGALLARMVWDLDLSNGHVHRTPQDEGQSSVHPYPTEQDFLVSATEWSARHVHNFICGVGTWDDPIVLVTDQERYRVRHSIAYRLDEETPRAPEREQPAEDVIVVRCKDGWVVVQPLRAAYDK